MAGRGPGTTVTRADVARLAGVAESTVSRVVSGHKNVSTKMRERVLHAVDELGYEPDLLARSLRSGSTKQIGLIVPDVLNPFFQGVTLGAGEEASICDYTLILGLSRFNFGSLVKSLVGRRVDAVVSCVGSGDADELGALASAGVPLCTCGFSLGDSQCVPSVAPDYSGGATAAARHLVELGHRRIALFPGEREGQPSRLLDAWRTVLREAGIEPVALDYGSWSYEAGPRLAQVAANAGATAALLASDLGAMGFVDAAFEIGLKVPDDISVVGFDDVWMASTFRPALTTVRQSAQEIGRKAVRLALALAAGVETRSIVSQTELIVRQSTAPPLHR